MLSTQIGNGKIGWFMVTRTYTLCVAEPAPGGKTPKTLLNNTDVLISVSVIVQRSVWTRWAVKARRQHQPWPTCHQEQVHLSFVLGFPSHFKKNATLCPWSLILYGKPQINNHLSRCWQVFVCICITILSVRNGHILSRDLLSTDFWREAACVWQCRQSETSLCLQRLTGWWEFQFYIEIVHRRSIQRLITLWCAKFRLYRTPCISWPPYVSELISVTIESINLAGI